MSPLYEYLVQSHQDDVNRSIRQSWARRAGRATARETGRATASSRGIRFALGNTHGHA